MGAYRHYKKEVTTSPELRKKATSKRFSEGDDRMFLNLADDESMAMSAFMSREGTGQMSRLTSKPDTTKQASGLSHAAADNDSNPDTVSEPSAAHKYRAPPDETPSRAAAGGDAARMTHGVSKKSSKKRMSITFKTEDTIHTTRENEPDSSSCDGGRADQQRQDTRMALEQTRTNLASRFESMATETIEANNVATGDDSRSAEERSVGRGGIPTPPYIRDSEGMRALAVNLEDAVDHFQLDDFSLGEE